jgi:hypothetical protein
MDDDERRAASLARSCATARHDERMAEDGIDTEVLHDYQTPCVRTRWLHVTSWLASGSSRAHVSDRGQRGKRAGRPETRPFARSEARGAGGYGVGRIS